jgi:hypothetical protein
MSDLAWYDTDLGPRPDCPECEVYLSQPHMAAAIAAVAISRRAAVDRLALTAVVAYHRRGHREVR